MALAAALVGAAARPCRAVDAFEIQVYEGDINGPGRPGLEIHANLVAAGPQAPVPPARVAEDGLARLTLEPSLGILAWWELGAYLQTAFDTGGRQAHFGGFKLRSKWIVPRRWTGSFIFGLNVEVGRGTAVFGADDWDTEFRPILVWAPGRWLLAANPLFGWALSGPGRGGEPDFEPAAKLRLDTGLGFGAGLEYYAGLGRLSALPAVQDQQHVLYLVADLLDARIDANLGLGHGLTDASNDWTVKLIVGLGF